MTLASKAQTKEKRKSKRPRHSGHRTDPRNRRYGFESRKGKRFSKKTQKCCFKKVTQNASIVRSVFENKNNSIKEWIRFIKNALPEAGKINIQFTKEIINIGTQTRQNHWMKSLTGTDMKKWTEKTDSQISIFTAPKKSQSVAA
jgi:hypothetical protein